MKLAFKSWNYDVFGNIENNVKLAIDEVMRIQELIDSYDIIDDLQGQRL
jgi:hypothetical protein